MTPLETQGINLQVPPSTYTARTTTLLPFYYEGLGRQYETREKTNIARKKDCQPNNLFAIESATPKLPTQDPASNVAVCGNNEAATTAYCNFTLMIGDGTYRITKMWRDRRFSLLVSVSRLRFLRGVARLIRSAPGQNLGRPSVISPLLQDLLQHFESLPDPVWQFSIP